MHCLQGFLFFFSFVFPFFFFFNSSTNDRVFLVAGNQNAYRDLMIHKWNEFEKEKERRFLKSEKMTENNANNDWKDNLITTPYEINNKVIRNVPGWTKQFE